MNLIKPYWWEYNQGDKKILKWEYGVIFKYNWFIVWRNGWRFNFITDDWYYFSMSSSWFDLLMSQVSNQKFEFYKWYFQWILYPKKQGIMLHWYPIFNEEEECDLIDI